MGQGLSGTIDMRTVRPLDFDKPVYAVSARYQKNSLGSAANSDGDGNRINASVIDADGRRRHRLVARLLAFGHSDPGRTDRPVRAVAQRPDAQRRAGGHLHHRRRQGAAPHRLHPPQRGDGDRAVRADRPSGPRRSTSSTPPPCRKTPRTSSKPTSTTTATPTRRSGRRTINGDGTLVGGTLTNAYPLVRGMYNKREDNIDGLGWLNEFKLGEVNLTADLSWSKSHRDELSLENNLQLLPNPQFDTLNIAFPESGFATIQPGRDYSNPATLFIANTIYGSGYGKTPKVVDELKGFKVNANFAAPFLDSLFSDIDVGAHYGDAREVQEPARRQHQPRRAGPDDHRPRPAVRRRGPHLRRRGLHPLVGRAGRRRALHDLRTERRRLLPRVEGVDDQRRHHHRLAARQHRHELGFDPGARQCRHPGRSTPTSRPRRSTGIPSARPARTACRTRTARPTPTGCRA